MARSPKSTEKEFCYAEASRFWEKLKAEDVGLKVQCKAGHKVGGQFDGTYSWGTDETVSNRSDSYNLLAANALRVK